MEGQKYEGREDGVKEKWGKERRKEGRTWKMKEGRMNGHNNGTQKD